MGDDEGRHIPVPPRRLVGDESIGSGRASVREFWSWAYSDMRDNVGRGVLAEWLVGLALDCVDGVRPAWANHDLSWDGIAIEVKSAAYLQSWPTARHSRISFGLSGLAWDSQTGEWDLVRSYRADVYVFAIQTALEHAHFHPLDVDQWEFWVAERAAVEGAGARSLGLAAVQNLAKGPVRFADLPGAVREASARGETQS